MFKKSNSDHWFGGLFSDKSVQEIERSLRAHRGALTKITCYIDTAVNAATIMPTEKGCREELHGHHRGRVREKIPDHSKSMTSYNLSNKEVSY